MQTVVRKLSPEWMLRLGLGGLYLYSGYDLLVNPSGWTWAVPFWFSKIVTAAMPLQTYLQLQGAIELTFAAVLLLWFIPRRMVAFVSLLSAFEFLFILIFAPQFSITFRDIGLLGAALALAILVSR